MNKLFEDFLRGYEIEKGFLEPIKDQLMYTIHTLTASKKELARAAKQELADIMKKLGKAEERFAVGEIDRTLFEKVSEKLNDERAKIEDNLRSSQNNLSNPEKAIEQALKLCTGLSNFWVSGDYDRKRLLQEIVFPYGIFFDKETNQYRTGRANVFIESTRLFSDDCKNKKSGTIKKISDYSASVVRTGIEPVLPE